ncbi:MAG TPA: TetR/AcrR family transcriptional regulator [Caulobacteraceae bacterium]|jgi:AcrR family transcriptional regulator
MGKPVDTRLRLIRAAEQLFRVQGFSGTGLKQVTAEAKAPWGSLYHFFPAGKAELGVEAARWAGAYYAEGWRRSFGWSDAPGEAIEQVFLMEAKILEGSDYRNGCPIASTTLDIASLDENLRLACNEAFDLWRAAIVAGFDAHGAPGEEAEALAAFVLSAMEGAITVARAAKSPEALVHTGRYVREAVDRAAQTWDDSR